MDPTLHTAPQGRMCTSQDERPQNSQSGFPPASAMSDRRERFCDPREGVLPLLHPGRLGWGHSRKGGGEDPDLRGLLIESTYRLSNCPGLSLMEKCLPNRPFCTERTKLRPDQGLETGSSQVQWSCLLVSWRQAAQG